MLDAGEVDETKVVCDATGGAAPLVASSVEPPGDACPEGGQRIAFGTDDDGDGVLDASEVDDSVLVCDGAAGASGCAAGGSATSAWPLGVLCAIAASIRRRRAAISARP